MRKKSVSIMLLALTFAVAVVAAAWAQSTTKTLSTNFTLINLGSQDAIGTVDYLKEDGTQWRASEPFTLTANGGQAIFRQYMVGPGNVDDDGRGAVRASANQPVGAVVQIQAWNQCPDSKGAYSGITVGDSSFYVPLVARRLNTAGGGCK